MKEKNRRKLEGPVCINLWCKQIPTLNKFIIQLTIFSYSWKECIVHSLHIVQSQTRKENSVQLLQQYNAVLSQRNIWHKSQLTNILKQVVDQLESPEAVVMTLVNATTLTDEQCTKATAREMVQSIIIIKWRIPIIQDSLEFGDNPWMMLYGLVPEIGFYENLVYIEEYPEPHFPISIRQMWEMHIAHTFADFPTIHCWTSSVIKQVTNTKNRKKCWLQSWTHSQWNTVDSNTGIQFLSHRKYTVQ